MGSNTNPFFGESFVRIKGRPFEHEAMIDRHGQLSRLLQARKCACITMGKPKLNCPLCRGKGYRFLFQSELEVFDEESEHCTDCPTQDLARVKTYWSPITRAIRVQRFLHPDQGGSFSYPIISFSGDVITIDTTAKPLKKYYQLKVSYAYRNANVVINEDSTHNGTYVLKTIQTEFHNNEFSNPLYINGDIMRVNRVYNVTQDYTYLVKSFSKQEIYLDPQLIRDPDLPPPIPPAPDTRPFVPSAPAPIVTDVLEVDYEYVKPFKIVTGRIESEYALQKWGEDIKMGDVEAVLPASYNVARGDIITFMTTLMKAQDVIMRGTGAFDELPQFDVFDILENIEDEDGELYYPEDFALQHYNDLEWTGVHKPAQGKKYSIMYRYRPSYTVYKKTPSLMNAEDKMFPQNLYLRLINKLTIQDIEVSQPPVGN